MSEDDTPYKLGDAKRLRMIEKHGIDVLDPGRFLEADHLVVEARSDGGPRFLAIGEVNGSVIGVIFTDRNGPRRIITARKARQYERENLKALHAGGISADEGQD